MKEINKFLIVSIFIAISSCISVRADSNASLSKINSKTDTIENIISGRWNKGPVFASATYGDYLYFGSSGSIRVVKVTKDANSKPIAWDDVTSIATDGVVRDMHIFDKYLYIADGSGWLRIISIENPAHLELKGALAFKSEVKGIDVVDNRAYIAAGWSGIHVINTEDKNNPILLKSIKPVGYALDLVVDTNYAYVAAGHSGFKIVDISNLDTAKEIAHYDVSGSVAGIAYKNDHVYLVNMDDVEPRLSVFNVSDRAQPKRIAAEPLIYGAERIRVDGSFAYVAGVANDAGLIVFDIGNPNKPQKLGSWWDPTCSESVTIDGDIAYLAHGDQGLEVIDLADRNNLEVIRHFDAAGHVRGLDTKGDLAFIANGYRGLKVVDQSDVNNLEDIAELKTYRALDVQVSGNYAHVADDWAGYKLIDISNPKKPKLLAELNTPGYAEDLFVLEKKVYIADGEGGLRIISIQDPTNPIELGGLKLGGYSYEVVVKGDLAYVAAGYKGLVVVDISKPETPKLVATFNANNDKFEARGVAIVGEHAYVAAAYTGMSIVNISNPKSLKQTGHYKTKRRANDISVVGNKAFVIDSATVKTLDITNIKKPELVLSQKIPVNSAKIHVEDEKVFVAGMESGLIVLRKVL